MPIVFFVPRRIIKSPEKSPDFMQGQGGPGKHKQEAHWKTSRKLKPSLGERKMALLAFYGGLMIGVATGIVIMGLFSMARAEESAQELDRH
jgi:hypothetical protein